MARVLQEFMLHAAQLTDMFIVSSSVSNMHYTHYTNLQNTTKTYVLESTSVS